jgi:hypothetical protein
MNDIAIIHPNGKEYIPIRFNYTDEEYEGSQPVEDSANNQTEKSPPPYPLRRLVGWIIFWVFFVGLLIPGNPPKTEYEYEKIENKRSGHGQPLSIGKRGRRSVLHHDHAIDFMYTCNKL